MKMSRLLVLSALGLASLSVNAADLVERMAPQQPAAAIYDVTAQESVDKTPAAYATDHGYLLYNPGAQLFFSAGNDYETRASLSETAPVVYFVATEAALGVGSDVVELKNYVPKFSEFRSAFAGGESDFWTDNNTRGDRFWRVTVAGDNTIRISNAINATDKFVGWKGAADDTRLYLLAEGEEGAAIDWQLFELGEWTAYIAENNVFAKSEELKKLIQDAEEAGVDVSAAVAVYNNLDATIEQMQAAMDALNEAITNNTFAHFTPGTALNVSSLIVNPDFVGNVLTGWSGTGFGSYGPKENAEHYNKVYDTYQAVSGLRPGLYVVGVNAFYRAGNAATAYTNFKAQNDDSKNAKFYVKSGDETLTTDIVSPFQGAPTSSTGKGSESSAKDEATGITYWIPNNMEAAEYYMHNLGLYKNNIFANITGSEITIGVKKEKTVSEDWSIFDDFSLIYCGDDDQAYKAYVNYFKTQYPDYKAQRTEFSSDFASMGINYTKSYMDAFDAFESNATSESEALADVERLAAVFAPLQENVALWNEFKATLQEAMEVASDAALDDAYTGPLADWAELDAEDQWNVQKMTNEELRALIDEKVAEIAEARRHPACDDCEIDMTKLLVNPDYEGTDGWTKEAAAGGNVDRGGNNTNHCYEAWNNSNFDIYQVVKDAPQGIYRIEVQGFYRYGRGDNAWNSYNDQVADEVKPGGAPVFVYLNAKKTPFQNVFDEKQEPGFYTGDYYTDPNGEFVYPNMMDNSAEAFSAGMYKQSAYGIIKAGQDMRIGVKGNSSQLGDSWVIWDNFKLFNCGKNAAAVMNVLPDEIANAESMLDQNMGKSIYDALLKAVNAAKAALETGEGETMFNALSDLFDAETDVNASVALFNKLIKAQEELEDAIGNSENDEAMTEAGELDEEITTKIEGHELENEDVDAYIAKIDLMKTKLALPRDWAQASDLDPKELDKVIRNASFDANNGNNWSGTAAGFQTYGNAEIFGKNYDFYQDITGLPAGTYEVQVQGFYRAGEAVDDYKKYVENPEKDNNAFLYAMVVNAAGDSIYSSNPLKRLASEAYTGETDTKDGFIAAKTDTIDLDNQIFSYVLVANNMSAAGSEFDIAKYIGTKVITKVGEDGKLRVGLMKNTLITNDWTIFDNFKLIYYGANSEQQPTPDGIENVTNAPALTVEFFTLDGRKANAAQRGLLIMKQTLSNGAIIVKKIQK